MPQDVGFNYFVSMLFRYGMCIGLFFLQQVLEKGMPDEYCCRGGSMGG